MIRPHVLAFVAAAFVLAAWAPAAAGQGVDCSRLTTVQARYWLDRGECTTPPRDAAPTPPADDAPTLEECMRVEPYSQPELAARCAALPVPADAVPAFRVGQVYAYGYAELVARVLGVAQDIDGVQVVTVRWLAAPSKVEAFRTPAAPAGSTTWYLVPGGA